MSVLYEMPKNETSVQDSRIEFSDEVKYTVGTMCNVTIKGFAARICFEDEETAALTSMCIEWFKAKAPCQLVWDGDELDDRSFTAVIPQIAEVADVKLVAFLRKSDKAKFKQSWAGKGLEINAYLCDDEYDWKGLGTHVLDVTKSKIVGCLGGGATIEEEYANKPADDVKFTMFAITRPSKDGVSIDEAVLQEEDLVEIINA